MEPKEPPSILFQPIAVVGIGALYPASRNADEFWRNIVDGRDLISDVPATHWLINDYYDPDPKARDKTYCKRGGFLPDFQFDPLEYGVPPANLPAIDTSQLLALIAAKEALGAEQQPGFHGTDLSRISVILGAAVLEAIQYAAGRMQRPVWLKSMKEFGLPDADAAKICDRIADHFTEWQENTFPGLLSNVVAGRVANRFNLGGSNCIVDAACAGSLAALSMAVNELQMGTADMVVTGGVDTLNDIVMYMCFSKTQALSLQGDCRPFSNQADGTIIGEGIGLFALKRLVDAERDGNPVYAVIKGIGTSSDGRSKSIYAPVPEGQQRAILRAYQQAGFSPATVELIEAHGTGTKAGDTAELQGLELAFNTVAHPQKPFCALGSIKSQIGHTKSAAGAAGLFKAMMSLHHKIKPPTLKIEQPNESIQWHTSPFYLNTKARPWIKKAEHPRRAGASSFGFGGSNFHVALEEYCGPRPALRLRTQPSELVLLTAPTPTELVAAGEALLTTIDADFSLSEVAYQSQRQTEQAALSRLAIVAENNDDFRQKLQSAVAAIKSAPEKPFVLPNGSYYGHAQDFGKVAFLFPGQGSQYLDMGADVAMTFAEALQAWDLAAGLYHDKKISDVVFPHRVFDEVSPQIQANTLIQTAWAQPALAVTSLSLLNLLRGLEVYPDCVAGHSFGELTALYAAHVFDETQLINAARARGEAMQLDNMPNGAMLSVFHPVADVRTLLEKWQIPLTVANFNSPHQVVLAGSEEQVLDCEKKLTAEKIQSRRLAVATGFHSPLVAPACGPFEKFLATLSLQKPQVPVYANTTAALYPTSANEIKEYLVKQLVSPVLFQQQIEAMYQAGARTFIEVGPQATLTHLVKQCLETRPHHAVSLDRKGAHGVTSLLQALGHLFSIGLNPNFEFLWKDYRLPAKPTARPQQKYTVLLNGTNYGKPYPAPHQKPIQPMMVKKIIPSLREQKTMSDSIQPGVISIVQELQKQLVDAHNTYQKAMAESHIAFLNSVSQLAGHMTGTTVDRPAVPLPNLNTVLPQPPVMPTIVSPPAPTVAPAAVVLPPPPVLSAAAPAPMAMPQAVLQAAPPPMKPVSLNNPPLVAPTKPAVKEDAPANNPTDLAHLKEILLKIVVDKTGYPAEMLSMDMAIEADLGIDSIKRIEILSALTETVPNLPEVNPNKIAELRTLGDIVNYMETQLATGPVLRVG